MAIETVTAISAPNKKTLLAGLWGPLGKPRGEPFIRCALPCGHVREWGTKDLVPDHSVECHCGELPYKHWFIRYDDEAPRPDPSPGMDAPPEEA